MLSVSAWARRTVADRQMLCKQFGALDKALTRNGQVMKVLDQEIEIFSHTMRPYHRLGPRLGRTKAPFFQRVTGRTVGDTGFGFDVYMTIPLNRGMASGNRSPDL